MNHVRFMISPELHVVQDRVQGKAQNLTRFGGGGEKESGGLIYLNTFVKKGWVD